jgi:hypothetical protein
MRNSLTRTFFAMGALACTTSLAAADDLGFSEIERSLSRGPLSQSAEVGARQVAYMSQDGGNENDLPSGMQPMMGEGGYDAVMASCHDGYCGGSGCGDPNCCNPNCCESGCCESGCCEEYYCQPNYCEPTRGMFYAETQLMFLRAHVLEDSIGKLSEQYELTPRFIVGYETPNGLGARARYWTYGQTTPNLQNDNDLRLDFDVIDVEGTGRFRTSRTDLVIAGGFRWLNADIQVDDESIGSDMPGITLAADLRSMICGNYRSEWSGVCGVRWSLMGGDWEGQDTAFNEPVRDDNMVVHEIYGGFEYLRHYRGCDMFARLVFEVQNWHSDSFSQNAGTDSIGFIGPGVHVGGTF